MGFVRIEVGVKFRGDNHHRGKRIGGTCGPPADIIEAAQIPRQRPIAGFGRHDFDDHLMAERIGARESFHLSGELQDIRRSLRVGVGISRAGRMADAGLPGFQGKLPRTDEQQRGEGESSSARWRRVR